MSRNGCFFCLGKVVYRFRAMIVLAWVLLILACLPVLPHLMSPFKTSGFVDEGSASFEVDQYANKAFNYNKQRVMISYTSHSLKADDPKFNRAIKKSLKNLTGFPIEHEIFYPDTNKKQISKDKHTAIVIVQFKSNAPFSAHEVSLLKELIKKPPNMDMYLGSEDIFAQSINKQTQKDLYKADLIATPVSIITLLLVFGSMVAAMVPIFLGGGCALLILTSLYFLGHVLSLSIFTINIALLLGLCLSLDYSLFIISRFRDELLKQANLSETISVTMGTAGKAVFFSGLAVFISLSALLVFPVNILFSVGVGGLTAVFMAVAIAISLLPAVLSILGRKIDAFSLFKRHSMRSQSSPFWRGLAKKVVKHPLPYFIFILMLLLFLGYPFLKVELGISDFHVLPKQADGRQFFDAYSKAFSERDLTPIVLVVVAKDNILSEINIEKLQKFSKRLKKNSSVSKVYSIVSIDNKLYSKQYYTMYHANKKLQTDNIRALLKATTTEHATMITVVSKYPGNSSQTAALISDIRNMKVGKGLILKITGPPVNQEEVLSHIKAIFPYALCWIIILTYFILLILLRSLFLPLKAILMNIISLSASYGVLVYVFQEGYAHQWLHFEPQGMLDISLLVIIFCALFGFSMDYEVFLLTRIKEFYDKTQDNKKSIVFGIEKSSRIITSAAIIVIVLCGSFMVADVLMVKEFGLGIAVAIFVDAFLVRSLLVPATMALLKQLNWYCPKWIKGCHR